MDTDFVDAVRDDTKTELSRLGSSKSLYADTEGEMEPDAVLGAAADDAHYAAEAVDAWGDGPEDVFAQAAASERDRYDAITDELDEHEPGERPAAVSVLRDQETPVTRLGALVGWTLVVEEKASQCSGFFTGQADPSTASLFRGFGDAFETTREAAVAALEDACADDEDRERAQAAATGVIEAAYDEYFETLEALGVNPKPVC